MIIFVDSSFANDNEDSTKLGYSILLIDGSGRANRLNFASYKCKRIVRSVLGGETYAFADGFDYAYMQRHDLEVIFKKTLLLTVPTDLESLLRVIIKASTTSEPRRMIDIRAARDAYHKGEISDVGLIRSAQNVSDGLTKVTRCSAL